MHMHCNTFLDYWGCGAITNNALYLHNKGHNWPKLEDGLALW